MKWKQESVTKNLLMRNKMNLRKKNETPQILVKPLFICTLENERRVPEIMRLTVYTIQQ